MSDINEMNLTGLRGAVARLVPESRSEGTRRQHSYVIRAFKMHCANKGFVIKRMSKKAILSFIWECERQRKSHGFLNSVSSLDNILIS